MTKPPRRRPPRCYVYVLASTKAGRTVSYVGWTLDLARRLAQHNAGTAAKSTRGRQWTVIHVETFASPAKAMSREWHLKRDRKFRAALKQSPKMLPIAYWTSKVALPRLRRKIGGTP